MNELIVVLKELFQRDWLDKVAMFAPLLLSSIAIYLAIYIPSRIAKQQNKIAIFKRRLDVYSELNKLKYFHLCLENTKLEKMSKNSSWEFLRALFIPQDEKGFVITDDLNRSTIVCAQIDRMKCILLEVDLIFTIDSSVNFNIEAFAAKYWKLGLCLTASFSEDSMKCKNEFIEAFDKLKIDDLLRTLREQIKLNNI